MTIDFSKLLAPFPPEAVSWRVGSTNKDKTRGLPLAYIDARDVMDRFDEVVGPQNWQCRYAQSDQNRTICEIGIRIDGEWVWKADGADDTSYEGVKGGLSDAYKRSAVRWGVGRYLYGLASPWVAIEAAGQSYKIAAAEMPRLRALLPAPDGKPVVANAPTHNGNGKPSRDIPVPKELVTQGRFAPYIKTTKEGKMWAVMKIKEDARALNEDLRTITDETTMLGFVQDNSTLLTAMHSALPEWHAAFERAYNQRGAEIMDVSGSKPEERMMAG